MQIIHRILIYIFPGIIILFEWLLLSVSNTNVSPAIGPSLASGALGLLVPLTTPKIKNSDLSEEEKKKITSKGYSIVRHTDTSYSSFCLLILLIFLLMWAYIASISVTGNIPKILGYNWRWDVIIGASSYVIAASLAEFKESF
jgi:hypothetical protein